MIKTEVRDEGLDIQLEGDYADLITELMCAAYDLCGMMLEREGAQMDKKAVALFGLAIVQSLDILYADRNKCRRGEILRMAENEILLGRVNPAAAARERGKMQ